MTDQLEQDLTALFARRAAEAEVPLMPPELFTGDSRRRPGRRVAIGLVAAAAAAAVAIPVGLSLRDRDDVQPAPAPAPTEPHVDGDVASIEVPYLREGVLHVGELALRTTATTIAAAGNQVYVGTDSGTWQRLVDDRLVAAPYLEGSRGVFPSPDGSRVAALVGDGQSAVTVMDPDHPSDVSTYTRSEPAGEEPWVVGFDGANRLFLHDGAGTLMKQPSGDEVPVQGGDRLVAALAPAGVVLVGPSGGAVAAVADDGTVGEPFEVPVSTAGVWDDAGRLAYVDGPGLRVASPQIGSVPVELMTDAEGTVQPLGWSDGRVVAQEWRPGSGSRVVLVDPESGEVEELFAIAEGDDTVVFPDVAGTGAL